MPRWVFKQVMMEGSLGSFGKQTLKLGNLLQKEVQIPGFSHESSGQYGGKTGGKK